MRLRRRNRAREHRGAPRDVRVLSEAECREIATQVKARRSSWKPRPTAPSDFYTLGTAAYIDLAGSPDPAATYTGPAAETNRLLTVNFDWVLERLRAQLATALDAPATLEHPLALPGFHIFEATRISTRQTPQGSIHFDLQHQALANAAQIDPDDVDPISFTLPIELPAAGGGLLTWPLTRRDTTGRTVAELAAITPPRLHRYQLGHAALHNGQMLHQIAPIDTIEPHDMRITLQGHGIRVNGTWWLYW